MERVCIGTVTVVLEHQLLRGQSPDEQRKIAEEFVAVLSERFGSHAQRNDWPYSAEFEITDVRSGCIETKLKIFVQVLTAVATVMTIIGKYPEVREAIPYIVKDAGGFYRCVLKDKVINCVAQARDLDVSKHLYQVRQGDTLSRIVTEEWRISQDRAFKFMIAAVKLNPNAFVNGDMNQLRAGAFLARPTDKMVSQVGPQR